MPTLPRLPYAVISRLLGLLVLIAAVLKAYGLAVGPVGPAGIFSAPGFQVGLIEFEVFLSCWLLWGKYPVGSWITAIASFAIFAGVSFHQGWIGQSSCGCFGKVTVRPWQAFAIDLTVIVGLLWCRPELNRLKEDTCPSLRRTCYLVAVSVIVVATLTGLLAIGASYWFGSAEAALAYLRGERLSVQPSLVDVGEGEAGALQTATVRLVNRTDHPIRVVGGTSDCSCVATDDLPVRIAGGDSHSIRIKVRLPANPGMFTREASLLTDDAGMATVGFRLTGKVYKQSETLSGLTE
jgi:hypothetical protein